MDAQELRDIMDVPETISGDIDKWKRWKAKENSRILLTRVEDNTMHFQVNTKRFTVTFPRDYPNDESILMIESTDGLPWINRAMNFTIRKTPSIFRLLKFIEKEKQREEQKKENEQNRERKDIEEIDVSDFYKDEELLEKFNIEEAKYEKKLKENLLSMKSTLVSDMNTKAPELFKGSIPGHILINMFMNVRKKYNSNSKISVSLKDENIYSWTVTFSNFKNTELADSLSTVKSIYGYDSIQVNILFHDKLFPSYPPFLKIVRPRMNNSLMHRISNLKMVQFDYWTPSRSMDYILDKLFDIFDKRASIDTESRMNDLTGYPDGAYHDLEGVLVKLASLCDVGNQYEELDETEYKKVHNVGVKKSSEKRATSSSRGKWAAGTGYGYSGASKWDIDEYVQLQQERDLQIQSILQRITDVLMSTPQSDVTSIYKILESSYLIPYIKTLFRDTTMVEIDKHMNLYKLIFTLLQFLVTEESVYLFDDPNGDKNLFEIMSDMNNEALTVKHIMNGQDGENAVSEEGVGDLEYDITSMITSLFDFVNSCYGPYYENKLIFQKEQEIKKMKDEEEKRTTEQKLKDTYVKEMGKYKFGMNKFINGGFHYKYQSTSDKQMLRAIGKECSSFSKSLPIHYSSSVLARVDSTNSRCIRVLITGPNGTPYDSGIHMFDVYLGDNFPKSNPQMHFENHGGVRFNPNLYDSGKVCLSLLGTWRGEASENWNPKTSTLSQLFISVQSQILTDDPYYNEPGWENSYGTESGKTSSKKYNNYVRQFNMQHAMVGIIESVLSGKYAEFKEPILLHFKLKKDYILDMCQIWVNEAMNTGSSAQHGFSMSVDKYKQTYAKLEELLNKL